MSEGPDDKATGIMHVLKAAFPTAHLPPWMSVHSGQRAAVLATLKTIGDIGEELDRRVWLDAHPNEPLPENMKGEEEFDKTRVRGGAGMFAFCLQDLAMNIHDAAPSENGLARRQGIAVATAQKTGVFTEPPKQSRLDKIRGKNKPKDQITGGEK